MPVDAPGVPIRGAQFWGSGSQHGPGRSRRPRSPRASRRRTSESSRGQPNPPIGPSVAAERAPVPGKSSCSTPRVRSPTSEGRDSGRLPVLEGVRAGSNLGCPMHVDAPVNPVYFGQSGRLVELIMRRQIPEGPCVVRGGRRPASNGRPIDTAICDRAWPCRLETAT